MATTKNPRPLKPRQTARLLRLLAAKLKKVPDERFDMGQWSSDPANRYGAPRCGSACCGLGWATAVPEIRKRGLRLSTEHVPYPVCGDEIGDDAGSVALSITRRESCHLFYSKAAMSRTRHREIAAIERMAAKYEAKAREPK